MDAADRVALHQAATHAIGTVTDDTAAVNVSNGGRQTITAVGNVTLAWSGFTAELRSVLLEIDVSSLTSMTWAVDQWWTDGGSAPDLSGKDKVRILADSYDNGTTINATVVGEVDAV